ncbi:MAG: riboflavin synthase [Gemmatimonadetes bacterium]|nr:riboflavin synthase [Gemmatimonadota bacterium]
MFTGLIEEVGTVRSVERQTAFQRLEIASNLPIDGTAVGDSISVNGACQTVVGRADDSFRVESVEETLRRTNLGSLDPGDAVNLERSMRADGRLGGHVVLGHVDGVGSLRRFDRDGENRILEIEMPVELRRFVAGKGSVAVDGISLTVVEVSETSFTAAIIPHTLRNTNLSERRAGDAVNLEIDVLARYVARLLET